MFFFLISELVEECFFLWQFVRKFFITFSFMTARRKELCKHPLINISICYLIGSEYILFLLSSGNIVQCK